MRFCWLFLCLCIFSQPGAAEIDRELLQELRTQGVAAWNKIERHYQDFQVEFREVHQEDFGGVDAASQKKFHSEESFLIAYNAARGLTLHRKSKPVSPDHVLIHKVANSNYSFEVVCEDPSQRGRLERVHILKKDRHPGDSPEYDEAGLPTWGLRRMKALAACRITGIPLQELIREGNPEFRLDSVSAALSGEESYINVVVSYLGEQRPARRKDGKYTIILDRNRDYRVVSFQIERPDMRETFMNTYYDDVAGFPHAPKQSIYESVSPHEKVTTKITYDFSEPLPFSIPEKEFYLPHYGFSEQVLETLHPNPWPRWLLIVGGILSLLIGGWLIRRRAQTA